MGKWDDMIESRQADAEYWRNRVSEFENDGLVVKRRDGTGWRDVSAEDLETARRKLADAEAHVARLREKND